MPSPYRPSKVMLDNFHPTPPAVIVIRFVTIALGVTSIVLRNKFQVEPGRLTVPPSFPNYRTNCRKHVSPVIIVFFAPAEHCYQAADHKEFAIFEPSHNYACLNVYNANIHISLFIMQRKTRREDRENPIYSPKAPIISRTLRQPCRSRYSSIPRATFTVTAGSMKLAVPISMAEAPAKRNSMASHCIHVPHKPTYGYLHRLGYLPYHT